MVTRNPLLTSDNTFNLAGWTDRITKDRPSAEQQAILDACTFAQQVHHSQTLPSGQPYLLHVITVADILVELGMDTEVLVAAILHDIVEDQQVTLEEIEKRFGPRVMRLVDGVTKMKYIEALNDHSLKVEEEDSQTENFRKMLLAMAEDVRVVLIKLADRLDNMHSLSYLPEVLQQRIARETLDLFAPLASRLGIWQIKWELEDLSLRYLEPETYQRLARLLAERRVNRENYIEQVVKLLREALTKAGIKAEVSGRPKHLYSIWRKMQRKGLDFDQIFDVRAVRVLVGSMTECYMALGVIHNIWQPIPGEFDDYVAKPKNNNYQSLHTAVLGPEQKIFEVQIRTQEMHHHAELGVASHWRYKEGGTPHDKNFELKIAWLRQMLQKDDDNNPGELIDRFKSEIFEDTVYVLSPQGKVVELPLGATPLDFAYYIHTQLGHCCRGAKIHHRMVPLTYILKSGDQVEILASKEERPSRDWLLPHIGYLKTSRARAKVRVWFKKQNIQQHISDGRLLLERELHRLNIRDYNLEKLANRLKFKTVDDLLASLGSGDTNLAQVANTFQEQVFPPRKKLPIVAEPSSRTNDGIYVKGVGNLLTQMAGCCKPVPHDSIVGYVSKGRGVVVHRSDCYNALRWQEEGNERLVEVQWSKSKGEPALVYPVDIQVNAYDRTGLLHDICSIVANEKINIIATNTLTDKTDNSANLTFTVEVSDLNQLSRSLAKIDNLPNVMKVWRRT
jgi:GTP pyrophosphokinase